MTLRVTTCDSDEALAAASGLFNEYRHHYGEPSDQDWRTHGWLAEMVRARMLTVFMASVDGAPVGVATSHAIPASLAMDHFWQLRDLYVRPGFRRRGVAAALLGAVPEAARAAGATRLSLVTELGNEEALSLYRGLGFRPLDGLTTLSLDIT
jgi:ribosomal protein S18 acetylase RimI-like enzyme